MLTIPEAEIQPETAVDAPTICVARLRSGVNYTQPLDHIMCSFFHVLKAFVEDNPELTFTYYNFGFGERPKRDVEAVKSADVIVIPSEAEWTYHIPGYIHTLDVKRVNTELDKIKPFIEDKLVVVLRSDRADDEQLYRTRTFPDIRFEYAEIDETDLPPSVYGVKYHSIKSQLLLSFDFDGTFIEKDTDFVYWGASKTKLPGGGSSGDCRHIILKQIHAQEDLSSVFIGRMHGFKRDEKFTKMSNLLPRLQSARATLCFNWMSDAVTARYFEAVACGVVPLVWKDYDRQNSVVADDWQRCYSVDDVISKIKQLKLGSDILPHIIGTLEERLPSTEEYEAMFATRLESVL